MTRLQWMSVVSVALGGFALSLHGFHAAIGAGIGSLLGTLAAGWWYSTRLRVQQRKHDALAAMLEAHRDLLMTVIESNVGVQLCADCKSRILSGDAVRGIQRNWYRAPLPPLQ